MDKVYLKYDDVRPTVECDFGFAKDMVFLGFMYPFMKGDLHHFSIILVLQISISILICILAPIDIIYRIILCIFMVLIINILFALNYNMIVIEKLLKEGYYPLDYQSSDKLIKKGIYFKLQ